MALHQFLEGLLFFVVFFLQIDLAGEQTGFSFIFPKIQRFNGIKFSLCRPLFSCKNMQS